MICCSVPATRTALLRRPVRLNVIPQAVFTRLRLNTSPAPKPPSCQHALPRKAKCRRQRPRATLQDFAASLAASPSRDLLATGFAIVGAAAVVKFFDVMASKGFIEQKLSRKLVHMSAGPLFLLSWPLFSASPEAKLYAAITPCLNMIRLLLVGTGIVEDAGTVKAVSREGGREELLRGPLYYVLVLIAATLLFWRTSAVGMVAMALMCGGDGLADVVGRRVPSAKLPYNRVKSVAGSSAMFVGGTALSLLFIQYFHSLGFMAADAGSSLLGVAAVAAAATAMESLPTGIDDNLTVPLTAALLGCMLLQGAVPVLSGLAASRLESVGFVLAGLAVAAPAAAIISSTLLGPVSPAAEAPQVETH